MDNYFQGILSCGVCSKTSVKDKEVALQQATCDAKLWEMRFQAAEKSREVYRESSRRLVEENDQLQAAISQVMS